MKTMIFVNRGTGGGFAFRTANDLVSHRRHFPKGTVPSWDDIMSAIYSQKPMVPGRYQFTDGEWIPQRDRSAFIILIKEKQ